MTMKEAKRSWLVWTILVVITSCSASNQLTQGKVSPKAFRASIAFTTAKSLILIPAEVKGEVKNFIFDTGAQVTHIQTDTIYGETISVRGGSNRTVDSGSETLGSFKISNVSFINTFATNGNEAELKAQIPNYGGTLGRTVMDKANWLIDYPNRSIEFSNQDLSDDSYGDIPLDKSSSTPYTLVKINGQEFKSIIDLGSTSIFNVPEETELAKILLNEYRFEERSRERYTVGGTETIIELIGTIPILTIGDLTFEDIVVNINKSSQIRLGMGFFTDYKVYIDNTNHRYRIKTGD